MDNDINSIHGSLKGLREQLAETESLPPEMVSEIQAVLSQIDQVIDVASKESDSEEEKKDTSEHESFLEQFSDVALKFEESHPTLYHTMQRLIDALGQLGI